MSRHMRTTVRLNDALLDEAKAVAEERGTTLTALMEKGLRWAIANPEAAPRKKIELPSGPPGHELMPGIDLNNSAQLWDLLDEEDGWFSQT